MLIFGHVAAAALAARLREETDLRWVALYALLADLIDKPLGLVVFRNSLNDGRVWAHSLLVNLALTALLLVLRKPPVYSLALWVHLLGDRMWNRPEVALWPLAGALGYRELAFRQWVASTLGPFNVATEAVALLSVVVFVVRHRLYEARRLASWLSSGKIPAVSVGGVPGNATDRAGWRARLHTWVSS